MTPSPSTIGFSSHEARKPRAVIGNCTGHGRDWKGDEEMTFPNATTPATRSSQSRFPAGFAAILDHPGSAVELNEESSGDALADELCQIELTWAVSHGGWGSLPPSDWIGCRSTGRLSSIARRWYACRGHRFALCYARLVRWLHRLLFVSYGRRRDECARQRGCREISHGRVHLPKRGVSCLPTINS